ncbi:MAG: tyrosine-type recombinase/integrase [Thermodesulfobacteriota bacterium]
MLSKLLPKAYPQYRTLPLLGPMLDEFVVWSSNQGHTPGSVREQLKHVSHIDAYLREQGNESLDDLSHHTFEIAWRYFRDRETRASGTVRRIQRFLDETVGLRPALPPPPTPTIATLTVYADYLGNVAGFAGKTVREHKRYVGEFLESISFDENPALLSRLGQKDIEEYVCQCAERLNRPSLQHVVGYLRSFLRFAYEQGVLEAPLHTMIDTPRVYRREGLPRSLSWEMVRALLSSIDRTNAQGIRDYTMLFLIATYGFRTCEIASLTLDGLNWREGAISITQGKTHGRLVLPLTDAAGDVLIEYLKKARPAVCCRHLFLRARAPFGPLKSTAVSEVFHRCVRRSGLAIPFYGAHCLRHSTAVHLLRQGASMKAIGDLLGHRSMESTSAYLRLSIEELRSVALPLPAALPDPEGTIIIGSFTHRYRPKGPKQPTAPLRRSIQLLRSFLAEEISGYVHLKHSLGRGFANETRTLYALDAFLAEQCPTATELDRGIFTKWHTTLTHLSSSVQRRRMLQVRAFCLYRCRSQPDAFVPDILTFPANGQKTPPYLFSEQDVARLLNVAQILAPSRDSPLRAETMRLAIMLLYTTGLRRGELLRLTLGDFDTMEATLKIQSTKFHKSRIVPLSSSVADQLHDYLTLRHKTGLPMDLSSALIWNARGGGEQGSSYSGQGLRAMWSGLCCVSNIFTRNGQPPRIHDLRHSFATNVLQRWYQAGEDVQSKLPLLSTYMGHISIVSTHYYLSFVEGIRTEASSKFRQCFGRVIRPFVPPQ